MTQGIGTTAHIAETHGTIKTTGFTTAQTSNVVLIVAVFGNNPPGAAGVNYTVSDTAGLTWANIIPGKTTISDFEVFYASAPSGVTGDQIDITRGANAPAYQAVLIAEVDGSQATFDPATAGFNEQTAPAPSCVTANANDIILAFFFDVSGGTGTTATYTNSYTVAISSNTDTSQVGTYISIAYKVVSATGTQTTTATFSPNNNSSDFGYIIGLEAAAAVAQTAYAQPAPVEVPLTAYLSETPYA